jgi:hypothetical protein
MELKELVSYLNSVTIDDDDQEAKDHAKRIDDWIQMTLLVAEDNYTARTIFFRTAQGMISDLKYKLEVLLPSVEERLRKEGSKGVGGQDFVLNNWIGTTNITERNVIDEVEDMMTVHGDRTNNEIYRDKLLEQLHTNSVICMKSIYEHDNLCEELGGAEKNMRPFLQVMFGYEEMAAETKKREAAKRKRTAKKAA